MGGEDRWGSAGAVKTCSKHGETLSVPKNCVILMILQISLRSWWESSRSKKKDESSQGRCLIGIIQVQPSSTTRKIAKKHRSVSWLWQIKPKEETQSTETLSISLSSEPLSHEAALLCAALVFFCFFFFKSQFIACLRRLTGRLLSCLRLCCTEPECDGSLALWH